MGESYKSLVLIGLHRHAVLMDERMQETGFIETERLIVRSPLEADRTRFVEMFTDPEFTVFSNGVHDVASANTRFDQMLALAAALPFAKQPVIERSTGTIVGYTGAGTVVLDGHDELDRLEWGWRFMPQARGLGYATEAASALLAVAERHADGEMLCVIDVDNHPSRRVADKLGFQPWRRFSFPNDPVTCDLLTRPIGRGGSPLLAPD